MSYQLTTVLLVLIATASLSFGNTQDDFPFHIVTPKYNLTWLSGEPYPKINTKEHTPAGLPYQLMSFHPTELSEIHLPVGIFNYTNADDLTNKVKTKGNIVSTTSLTGDHLNYTYTIVNQKNYYGIQSNTTLPNGATFSFIVTVNTDSNYSLPIPRSDGQKFCQDNYKFATNCSCDAEHEVEINSIKISLFIEDWPWEDLTFDSATNQSFAYRNLVFKVNFITDFNLEYYASIPDASSIVTSDVCDVLVIHFNISGGDIICPFSFFRFSYQDGVPQQVYSIFDRYDISVGTGPGEDKQVSLPITVLLAEFNETLVYDPDFSVLFKSDEMRSETNSVGETTTDNTQVRTILLAVLLPLAVLSLLAMIIGVVVTVVKRRRALARLANSMGSPSYKL